MPELPEVETIRSGLEKYLVGARIMDIDVRLPRIFSGSKDSLVGAKVDGVRRFGKGLVIDFDNDYALAVHVKMTGQLVFLPTGEEGKYEKKKVGATLPGQHTHVVMLFDHGTLYYNDIRQFGWLQAVRKIDLKKIPFFKTLGKEPLKDLDLKDFTAVLRSGSSIKNVIMDQAKIAGVGNIYANDALFLAKIHPKRRASSLSVEEQERLFLAIEEVLQKGLATGGASEWQYVNVDGQSGGYQNFFQVYGKVGKPCVNCGVKIEKITLGGRGTFFCASCQKI